MNKSNKSLDRKAIIKLLEKNNWYPLKQKGGHLQFKHPIIHGRITVPYHISKNIEISILSKMGLRRDIYKETKK